MGTNYTKEEEISKYTKEINILTRDLNYNIRGLIFTSPRADQEMWEIYDGIVGNWNKGLIPDEVAYQLLNSLNKAVVRLKRG